MSSIIIVLAKAPILGEVKTRIGKNIGMDRSKWIYEQLLSHTSNVTKKTKIKTSNKKVFRASRKRVISLFSMVGIFVDSIIKLLRK